MGELVTALRQGVQSDQWDDSRFQRSGTLPRGKILLCKMIAVLSLPNRKTEGCLPVSQLRLVDACQRLEER
jgi:hypothetical protein